MRCWFIGIFFVYLSSACVSTSHEKILYYKVKVKEGESLAEIAARFDCSWQTIARDNGLSSSSEITPGMELKVRPGPGGYIAGTRQMKTESRTIRRKQGLFFGGSASSGFVWPLNGPITSHFGRRKGAWHSGVDIDGRSGDKVRAAAKGIVAFAGRSSGYGKTIIINHGDYRSLYAHLSDYDVSQGDIVVAGHSIGEVGSTGHATGSHLHFEIRDSANKALNPLAFLPSKSNTLLSSR